MLSRLDLAIDLLHSVTDAALATHSASLAGLPFASNVPFVVDEHQCPILLISGLAEHTRNLAANPRASLMIAKALGEGEVARISLVGEVHALDPHPRLVTRYLRYHPHAERFLLLGDFGFYRLEPVRVMTVGGFAKASWLEGERLLEASSISLAQEVTLLEAAANVVPDGLTLLGVDAYGVDLMASQGRARVRFGVGPVTPEALLPTLVRELEHQGFAVRKPLPETP